MIKPSEHELQIGDLLEGFCGGRFGRDSYGTKRVEAIGADWVVCRDVQTGRPEIAFFPAAGLVEYRVELPSEEKA